ENIDLTGMVLGLRARLPQAAPIVMGPRTPTHAADYVDQGVLLAGRALRENEPARRAAVLRLGCTLAADDGDDIALALEAGVAIPAARREEFLPPLRKA